VTEPEHFGVEVNPEERVTARLYPTEPSRRVPIALILGHGAGAGQASDFMRRFATGLAARGIDVVTFDFAYMEKRRRMPDPGDRLEACYRAVIDTVRRREDIGGDALAIGGKSMGGRIATQVAAKGMARALVGLVLLGYPLHPPGKPNQLRAKHLAAIKAPALFVQGSRDAFGTPEELRPVVATLAPAATLRVVEGGDHSFKVPKRLGVTPEAVYEAIQDDIAAWLRAIARR
jgi:uncharacterized protein